MDNSVPTISVALILGALILKSVDLVKYVKSVLLADDDDERNKGLNGLVSLVLTSVAGVGIVLLFKLTQWADDITFGDTKMSDLNTLSSIVLGLVISSFGSLLYDYKKAIDNKDDARTPRMVKHGTVAEPVPGKRPVE
ncbi:hypothetical protein ACWD0J_05145 [Streptomyces sp. NPDC003011]